jgi:hypothetical protein
MFKCTRKTENKLRVIVATSIPLSLLGWASYEVGAVFVTKVLLGATLLSGFSVTMLLIFLWLMGDINFCKGK